MQGIHKTVVSAGDAAGQNAFDRPLGLLAHGLPGKLN